MLNLLHKKTNRSLASSKGFTLIELLVVMAIVGVLSTLIFSGLNEAKNRANNLKVRLQVKQIINALFLARDETTGDFPGLPGWQCLKASGTCWASQGSAIYGNSTIDSQLAPFISSLPLPPDPPFDSNTLLNGGYTYLPNYTDPQGLYGSPGTYLVWAQEGRIPDCQGYYPGAPFEQNFYYCYQLVAPL